MAFTSRSGTLIEQSLMYSGRALVSLILNGPNLDSHETQPCLTAAKVMLYNRSPSRNDVKTRHTLQ